MLKLYAMKNSLSLRTPMLLKSVLLCTGLVSMAPPALALSVTANTDVPATFDAVFTGDCSNKGSQITLGPSIITLHNVPVTIVFDGGGDHDQTVSEKVDLTLNLENKIKLPKQPALSGVTGNPNISVYLNGDLIVGPTRCNKF